MTDAPHVPVLKAETLSYLQPGPGKRMIDGTFGFGGHSVAMAEAGAEVLGLDLDTVAIDAGRRLMATHPNLQVQQISFRHLDQALVTAGWDRAHGILLDLGVSSLQLDDPNKGFSYRSDGPLDLRFNQTSGETAAELMARLSEAELADVIWQYGEERGSRRMARVIKGAEEPIVTTYQLRNAVESVVPRGRKTAPALSRVFQALRIAVNGELDALGETLAKLPAALGPGGRFVVISYHSLEDRLVKRFIDREKRSCLCPPELPACVCGHQALLKPLTRKAVKATADEEEANPRSRSARLRAAEILPLP